LGEAILKRVATAFFLIPAVVALVLYGPPFLLLLVVMAITFLALLEFNKISSLISGVHGVGVIAPLIGLILPLSVYYTGLVPSSALFTAAFFVFLFLALPGVKNFRQTLPDTAMKTTGLVYIALPLSYFILLASAPAGRWWILFYLIVIWCNDSFAYIFGKALGRHKLCPSISPGKTIEGAVGGLISGVAAALIFNTFTCLGGYGGVILIALVTGTLGIFGDLSESVLKRGAGVKDSGTIVPGHGGVLDRIDSMFFSLPAVYILAIYFKI